LSETAHHLIAELRNGEEEPQDPTRERPDLSDDHCCAALSAGGATTSARDIDRQQTGQLRAVFSSKPFLDSPDRIKTTNRTTREMRLKIPFRFAQYCAAPLPCYAARGLQICLAGRGHALPVLADTSSSPCRPSSSWTGRHTISTQGQRHGSVDRRSEQQ
jgi:hypothetical protein